MTLLLSNEDITELLTMPETLAVLEDAYIELAHGRGINRRRSDLIAPGTLPDSVYGLKSMDGVAPKQGVAAIRINSDTVTWPVIDGKRRRVKNPMAPGGRYTGIVLVFSTATGEPLAMFPDGVVQRMRVGATNGLGVKHMARPDATKVGIVGSGWQAGAQLMAVCAVRTVTSIKCFSPTGQNRERFCREMSKVLGIEVVPVLSMTEAFKDVDIALNSTSSIEPIFTPDMIAPGMHVSAIKAQEIGAPALKAFDRVAMFGAHSAPQVVIVDGLEFAEGKGDELEGGFDATTCPTLPQIIAGLAPGRRSAAETTCFVNNLGMGYQFAAVGGLLIEKARAAKAGRELPTEWFTEDVHP
jgi:alanine dehydrogenase